VKHARKSSDISCAHGGFETFSACFFLKKPLIVRMTIWLLAVLLLAALAALGLRQGAIRVLASFFGIVIGGLLAGPLGHLFKPLVAAMGLTNPVWTAFLPPCIGFLIVLTGFKVAGLVLSKKVELHFKYSTGEVQQLMWARLDHRLGLCLGFFNGAAYLVLLMGAIYPITYWTVQMSTPDQDPKTLKIVNRVGKDLEATGMNRVAVSVNNMPTNYYLAGDIVGLIYKNPLLEARLSRYPAIIALSEKPVFQDLANDQAFTELRLQQKSVLEILNYPKVQAIIQSPENIKTITNALLPNLVDLQNFLLTAKSQTFSEEIYGRWDFDLFTTMTLYRKAHPNLTAVDAKKIREAFRSNFAKMTFTAAPDDFAALKNYPHIDMSSRPPTIQMQNSTGQWNGIRGTYTVNIQVDGKEQQLSGEIHGDRLALSNNELALGFVKED
jgi:hypothetical protein